MTNKFKVGDKVVPINDLSGFGFPQGEVATIVDVYAHGTVRIRDEKFREATFYASTLQLAEPKPTKEQRISKLEEEVAELKSIVEQISKPSPLVSAASIIALGADEPKTANQLRAEIIEKAKYFIKYLKKKTHTFRAINLNGEKVTVENVYLVPAEKNIGSSGLRAVCNVEFVVNAEKGVVVALLKGYHSKLLRSKGIAKCDPSDVFNEHIGKAIALGRALGLDVSEFEQAVQPSLAVGQECVIKNWKGHNGKTLTITKVFDNGKKANHNYKYGYLEDCHLTIINDTNAQYGGVE